MSIEGTKTLKNLFENSGNQKLYFEIPKYQRDFSWKKEQIQQLINDIDENTPGHFIGTFIFYKQNDKAQRTYEIIDGQQRITSISLILGVLYRKLEVILAPNKQYISWEELTEYVNNLSNIKNFLIHDSKTPKLTLAIRNGNNDRYKHFLFLQKLLDEDITTKGYGTYRIAKAVKDIESYIDDLTVGLSNYKEKLKKLFEFSNKLLNVYIATIETTEYSDAYNLFECINNRGMDLAPIDLIKNAAYRRYTNLCGNTAIDELDKKWQDILNNLENTKIQTRFLRQYYNAFKYQDKIQLSKREFPINDMGVSVPKATASNLGKVYTTLIDRDVKYIIEDLINKSDIYAELTSDNAMHISFKDDLIRLKRISFEPSYTFLLYLFTKKPYKNENDEINSNNEKLLKNTIDLLVKFAYRRHLTDSPKVKELDSIFMNLIEECEKNDKFTFHDIRDYLTSNNRFSNINKVIMGLCGDIYDESESLTRFTLSEINDYLTVKDAREIEIKSPWTKGSNDQYIYQIEHILPQSADLSQYNWAETIADGDLKMANEIRQKYRHKLGNLTLSAYNQKLSKKDFIAKRDQKETIKNCKDIYTGFKNGLGINDDIKNETTWNKQKIIERTNRLVGYALEIFKLPNETLPRDTDYMKYYEDQLLIDV